MLAWSKLIPDYLVKKHEKHPISIRLHRSRFFVDINPDHPLFLKRWRQSIRMTRPWYKTDVLSEVQETSYLQTFGSEIPQNNLVLLVFVTGPIPHGSQNGLGDQLNQPKMVSLLVNENEENRCKIGLWVLGTTNLRSFSTNRFKLSINLVIHCLYFGWGVKPSWTFISSDLWRHSSHFDFYLF